MKKRIISLIIVLIFSTSIFLANSVHTSLESRQASKKPKSLERDLEDWARPDMKFLDYYGLGDFKSKHPLIYINSQGEKISKEEKIWATIAISNAGGEKNISQEPDRLIPATINLRGASSYSGFDKEQYRIEFFKERGVPKSKDYDLFGMGENSEWVLNGPFLDMTLLRNHLIYNLSREIFHWAPKSEFCEVFVDGKYRGVYLAVEPITRGENRLDLKDFGLLTGETAYILNRDRVETKLDPLKTYGLLKGKTLNSLYISYPSHKNITKEQRKWIEKDINKFEKALYSHDFRDSKKGYLNYIDLENFVDYFILNEVVMNIDAGNLSTYLYKDIGEPLRFAVWDFNNSYDNYQWFSSDFEKFRLLENSWFDRLLKDRLFVDKVVARYAELRKGTLKTEYMYSHIHRYEKEIEEARKRNFVIWGYTFEKNLMNDSERAIKNYNQAIDQLKGAIEKRFSFLDEHIEDLYYNCIN